MVAPGAPQHEVPTLGGPLHQNLVSFTHSGDVLLPHQAAYSLDEPLQTLRGDLVGDVSPKASRRGALAHRVFEGVRVIEPGGGNQIEGFLEIGLSLAGKAHDDVG